MSRYLVRYKEGTIERTIPLDAASVGLAREACKHHHPGCQVVSVQEARPQAPAKSARSSLPPVQGERATEEQTRTIADGLRAFRARLAVEVKSPEAVACPVCDGPARVALGRASRKSFVLPGRCGHPPQPLTK